MIYINKNKIDNEMHIKKIQLEDYCKSQSNFVITILKTKV